MFKKDTPKIIKTEQQVIRENNDFIDYDGLFLLMQKSVKGLTSEELAKIEQNIEEAEENIVNARGNFFGK